MKFLVKNIPATYKEISEDSITEMCRQNQFISLIKEYRSVSGLGLKDSKDAMEKRMRV